MHQWTFVLALVLLGAFSKPSPGCTCGGVPRAFADGVRDADAVLLARVDARAAEARVGDVVTWFALDVQVLRGFKGVRTETLRVWGGLGPDCKVYVGDVPIGSTWFFALSKLGTAAGRGWYRDAKPDDLYLPVCARSMEQAPEDAARRKRVIEKVERELRKR